MTHSSGILPLLISNYTNLSTQPKAIARQAKWSYTHNTGYIPETKIKPTSKPPKYSNTIKSPPRNTGHEQDWRALFGRCVRRKAFRQRRFRKIPDADRQRRLEKVPQCFRTRKGEKNRNRSTKTPALENAVRQYVAAE
jgi:hypothetical protein